MEKIDIKADFHIHTPSSKDYKGQNNEEEYLGILRQAIVRDLKIIAITDHNSVEGYRHLIEIKESLISKKMNCRI